LPWPGFFISSSTAFSPALIDLEHKITFAPAKASALTVSKPIPELPPVTIAVFRQYLV